jgi:hypothetical protein
MPIISTDIWTDRSGQQVEIKNMASSHLLATIHFIERNRFINTAEVYFDRNFSEKDRLEMANYYAEWPIQYETLIAEAQRRHLIYRGIQGIVKA